MPLCMGKEFIDCGITYIHVLHENICLSQVKAKHLKF